MSEPEDYSTWAHKQRVAQEQWDRATASLREPAPPTPDWSAPSPPRIELGTYTPGHDYRYSRSYPSGNASFLGLFAAVPCIAAWPLLYVVPVTLGFAVTAIGYGILEALFEVYRPAGQLAIALAGGVPGLIAVIVASRLDHRLARSWLWRAPRHLLRLALVAAVVHVVAAPRVLPAARNDLRAGLELLGNPIHLATVAGVVLLAHWILTRKRLRDWWHERLEAIGLRPGPRGSIRGPC